LTLYLVKRVFPGCPDLGYFYFFAASFPWFSVPATAAQPNQQGYVQGVQALNATQAVCPTISLLLNSIEVYDPVVKDPYGGIRVQCYTRNGTEFPAVSFPTTSETAEGPTGARYTPGKSVAEITCGEAVSCRVSTSTTAPPSWDTIADGACWFDFRHFTQRKSSFNKSLSRSLCMYTYIMMVLMHDNSEQSFLTRVFLFLHIPPPQQMQCLSSRL